jgi:hypothetical protein
VYDPESLNFTSLASLTYICLVIDSGASWYSLSQPRLSAIRLNGFGVRRCAQAGLHFFEICLGQARNIYPIIFETFPVGSSGRHTSGPKDATTVDPMHGLTIFCWQVTGLVCRLAWEILSFS